MRFNVRTLRTTDLHRPSLCSAGSASSVNSFLVSSWSQVRLNQTWSSLWKFWSGEEQEAGEGLMIHPSPVRCAFKHPSQWRSKKLRHVIRTGLHWLTGDICLFRCFLLQTSEKMRPPRLSEGLKQPADWFLCEGRRVFTKSRGCGASALSRGIDQAWILPHN